MTDAMTTAEFLRTMREGRARWDALAAAVPRERLSEPGLEGEWSLKDVLAHISFYERWMTDQVRGVLRGETQMVFSDWIPAAANTPDMHQRNAVIFAYNRERSLDDVLAGIAPTFNALREAVAALSDEQLNDTSLPWTRGSPLWEVVAGDCYEHYEQHIPPLRAWLEANSIRVPAEAR